MNTLRSFQACLTRIRVALGLSIAGVLPACAQTFTGLGFLPGQNESRAMAVSGDGSVVVGYSGPPVQPFYTARAFRWTRAGGLQEIGALPPAAWSEAEGVSADGSVVVGWSGTAFRWTSREGVVGLGAPAGSSAIAHTASADGSVIVGQSGPYWFSQTAFRWSNHTGYVALGTLPGFVASSADGVSADGTVIVGTSRTSTNRSRAYRWTSASGMVDLGLYPGASDVTATGVSGDGTAIVGYFQPTGTTDRRPFRWTSRGFEGLPFLGARCSPFSAGNDGSVLVGYADTFQDGLFATVWTPQLGIVNLSTYLSSLGVDLSGWRLTFAIAVSADGRTIVGWGTHNRTNEAWVATIPVPCRADFNGDAAVNVQDFFAFLGAFANGDARADLDRSGVVNLGDFVAYLNAFALGC
jgi:probable HAF family extracellular repeat protein